MEPRAARTPQGIVVRSRSRPALLQLVLPAGPARALRSGPLRPVPAQRPGIGGAPAAGKKREPPRRRGLSTGEGATVGRLFQPVKGRIFKGARYADVQVGTVGIRHDLKPERKERRCDAVIPSRMIRERDNIGRAADQVT